MNKEYISRSEAAKMLGVTNQTISNYANKGVIHATKRKNLLLVSREDVQILARELKDIIGIEQRIDDYKEQLSRLEEYLKDDLLFKSGFATELSAATVIALFRQYIPDNIPNLNMDVTAWACKHGYKSAAKRFGMTEWSVMKHIRWVKREIQSHKNIFALETDNEALGKQNQQLIAENNILRAQLKEKDINADEVVVKMTAKQKLRETKIYDLWDEYPLSVRTINCLKANEIETVGDLAKLTKRDILKIRNAGKKTLREIVDFAESLGLELKD